MTLKLDVQQFVKDYRGGVKDRELLVKYKINAKELVAIVRKLINSGQISKEDYFGRNRKIDELRALQEKDFLKSLHHCPICNHVQPTPFATCPACGADIAEHEKAERSEDTAVENAVREKYGDKPKVSQGIGDTGAAKALKIPAAGQVAKRGSAGPAPVTKKAPAPVPGTFQTKVGMSLQDFSPLDATAQALSDDGYTLAEIVSVGSDSAMFKARPRSKQGRPLLAKIFDTRLLPDGYVEDFFARVISYQTGMDDVNILTMVGTATVKTERVLVYEYMPTNLEEVLHQQEEGISLDMMMGLLPQILNAVGYSHMHRGKDGEVRRLPHFNLRPDKFLFNEETQQAKLEDCAVWRSLVEVRGHKKHLWEEPGVDLSALAPECFVLESKFVNAFLADIYGLGVVLYKLATGRAPFSCSDPDEYRFAHLKTFPIPPRVHRYTIPGWLDGMILRCLEKEPGQRWRSATQMELAIRKDMLA